MNGWYTLKPSCRRRYSIILVDVDGVVWRTLKPLEENIEGIRMLARESRIVFMTNNSSRSRRLYAALLRKITGLDIDPTDIVSSSYAAAVWIKERLGAARVYVVGGPGLVEELVVQGHMVVTEDEAYNCLVDAVVVGFTRAYSHATLSAALHAIRECNAVFIATNTDRRLPSSAGYEPGAGGIVALLSEASSKRPVVVGKPNPYMARLAGIHEPGRALIVGDSVETDIELARRIGAQGLLVDDGVDGVEDRGDYMAAASVKEYALLPTCMEDYKG